MDNENPEIRQPEPTETRPPAPRPAPPRREETRRRPSIVGPVVLIALGLLFLAYNLGMVPGETVREVWRLWPILLVLAGLEIIFGRTNWVSTFGIVFLALVVMAFVGSIAYLAPWTTKWAGSERVVEVGSLNSVSSERVVEDLGGAQSAVVKLQHGAGRVFIDALDSSSEKLIDADLAHGEYSVIERSIDRQGSRVFVDLRNRMERNLIHLGDGPSEEWSIRLSPKLPMELSVNSGASELNLDLSELLVTRLTVEAGASGVNVTLPAGAGHTSARIKAGAAGIDVRVPDGVAARIRVQGGFSGTDVDTSRFRDLGGGRYETSDYAGATNRVDLEIETGISGVSVS